MTGNEINEKIAKWAGTIRRQDGYNLTMFPDYQHSGAAAIELLSALVEKGYVVSLDYHFADNPNPPFVGYKSGWHCSIFTRDQLKYWHHQGDSVAEAITSALCYLIDKEDV